MSSDYLTLKQSAEERLTIQKSVFIGHAAPCASESDALNLISEMKSAYKDASHHCYAYIIGKNEGILRYSDDREPSGTAGLPILSLLRAEKLVNCCVVVTRYFGGILLGTGGLVRAYTQACRQAVDAAGIVCMELSCRDLCEVPYPYWERIQYAIDRLPAKMTDIAYGSAVTFTLVTRKKDREHILDTLANASQRTLEMLPDEEGYEAWDT